VKYKDQSQLESGQPGDLAEDCDAPVEMKYLIPDNCPQEVPKAYGPGHRLGCCDVLRRKGRYLGFGSFGADCPGINNVFKFYLWEWTKSATREKGQGEVLANCIGI